MDPAESLNRNTVDPNELNDDAEIAFAWHFEPTRIAGQTIELAVASDPDGMLIDACERQDRGETGVIDPFWAATWRAAAGLDRYLEGVPVRGQRVLELGCGTGHAGISAALRGGDVTLTDGVIDPLRLVRRSLASVRPKPAVCRLRFGIDQLDTPPFDFVLGSDVTYLRQLWPQLEQCVSQHLTEHGRWLLSDPYRIIANEFREWIQATGRWDYREIKVSMDDDPDHPIRIMDLQRRRDDAS